MNDILSPKKVNRIGISFESILTFFIAAVVILNSGYYRALNSYAPLVLLILVSAVSLLVFRTRNKPDTIMTILLLCILFGIALSVLGNASMSNLLSGGRVAVTIICCFVLFIKIDVEMFIKQFSRIIRWVIYASIVVMLVGVVFGRLPGTLYGGTYYDYLVVTATSAGGRAMGCFWEPGVFASVIIMAMVLEIYFAKSEVSLQKIIVYCIGVLISRSTAGILLLFLMLIAFIWKRQKFSKNTFANLIFVALVVVMILGYEDFFNYLNKLNPEIFGKLVETNSSTTATRMNAPIANLNIFAYSPVYGFGFTDAATLFTEFLKDTGADKIVAQTSTSTQILSSIGFLGLAYTVMTIMPLLKYKKNGMGFVGGFVLSAIMLLIVNKEPHIFIAISWIVLMFFHTETKKASKITRGVL
ncbi:MAG: O-antigen ligase family protein [Acutalibacteraceae bacterium]|nr:O-antigen ligase family protein [Acutalibacteraceae bacterium]